MEELNDEIEKEYKLKQKVKMVRGLVNGHEPFYFAAKTTIYVRRCEIVCMFSSRLGRSFGDVCVGRWSVKVVT